MKPYKILARTTDMDHEEWLRFRRRGIGGSDAATILGPNPYSSVYADKMDARRSRANGGAK